MTRLAFALPVALAFAVACYVDPAPPLDGPARWEVATRNAAMAVVCDAGLCGEGSVEAMTGVTFRAHEGSDGHSWAPDEVQSDAGYVVIFGDASRACPREPMPHVIALAATDFRDATIRTVACHELGHVARGCWMDDHEFFRRVQLDTKCRDAMRGVVATTLSGASGGT